MRVFYINIKYLLNYKMETNVNVVVLGKKFTVSKLILSKLDYFNAIFQRWDNKEECIYISDRCPDSFKLVLDYLIYDTCIPVKHSYGSMVKFISDCTYYGAHSVADKMVMEGSNVCEVESIAINDLEQNLYFCSKYIEKINNYEKELYSHFKNVIDLRDLIKFSINNDNKIKSVKLIDFFMTDLFENSDKSHTFLCLKNYDKEMECSCKMDFCSSHGSCKCKKCVFKRRRFFDI